MTNHDGKFVWQSRLSIFGKTLKEYLDEDETFFPQNLRFQGQYLDRETGLHYNTFRYYDPEIGRFTQQDPIGLAGGFNLYQYAPNTIAWIDPWGWSCFSKRVGNYSEKRAMSYLESTGKYKRVFSIQNNSGHGLDIVGQRADGKFDIFEVKSSTVGNFELSSRQATGKSFANTVLNTDVSKGGYYMIDMNGNKTPMTAKQAAHIYNNLGDAEWIKVDIGHRSNGWFYDKQITFENW